MNPDLFQCIRCSGRLEASDSNALRCSTCGTLVDYTDGILDFVAGSAGTKLDDIDYDEFYRIDDEYSHIIVGGIKSAVGDLWPKTIGTVAELGCGTGGFSRALLQTEQPESAVLTDVSPKMLRICRQHLQRIGVLSRGQITFATYSGAEKSLATAAFDTCVGTSVLHHIIDVRSCLADIHRILKPDGRAFFLEPNHRFHHALYATLADVVAFYLSKGVNSGDEDLNRITSWVCETRCNSLHAGDLEFLATREDKHMFTREDVRSLASDTGFADGAALPVELDPIGLHTAEVYLAQCGVSAKRREDLKWLMPALRDRYFGLLSPEDQSPSYVLAFSKSTQPEVKVTVARKKDTPRSLVRPSDALQVRMHLELSALATDDGISVAVRGWCVAIAGVRWIRLTIGRQTYQVPVWLPRMDVHTALSTTGAYPSYVTLCSGVDQTILLPQGAAVSPAYIDIVVAEGSVCGVASPDSLALNGTITISVNV